MKEYDKAIKDLDEAIRLDPRDFIDRGKTAREAGKRIEELLMALMHPKTTPP